MYNGYCLMSILAFRYSFFEKQYIHKNYIYVFPQLRLLSPNIGELGQKKTVFTKVTIMG
jgi:hypothetical protein